MKIKGIGGGAGRLGAAVWAPAFGRRRFAPAVWAHGRLGAGRLGAGPYERGNRILLTLSLFHQYRDENDACFTAIEAGWTDIDVDTYSAMKITRVSLQSNLDKLMALSTRIPRVNLCSNDIIFIAAYA